MSEDENEIKYLGQDDIRDYIMKKDYEIYKLQQRINKVIEYIENEETYEEGYCDGKLMIYKDRLEYELLNILRGENNENYKL